MAVRLRQALFTSILEQDMDFFDTHKTGELVSRCADDFKTIFLYPLPHLLISIPLPLFPPPTHPGSREMSRS